MDIAPSSDPTARSETSNRPLHGATLGTLLEIMRDDPTRRPDAWGECFRQYGESKRVWRWAYFATRSMAALGDPRAAADDVTSTVFLALEHAVRRYQEQGKAEQWLKRFTLNVAYQAWRKETGRWKAEQPGRRMVDYEAGGVIERLLEVIDEVEQEERMELNRRLDRWRGDPDKALWLEHVHLTLEGYSHDEIAKQLGITPGTSRNLAWKIRKSLGAPLPPQ